MFTRLIRAAATALVLLTSMVAAPAFANVKTVNGISAEVNLPQIQRGVPYSFQIAPTGPTGYSGSYTFQLLSGTLPAGITVSSGGLVTGTTCINNGSYAGLGMRIRTAPGTTTADFTGSTAFSVNVTTAPANGCSITVTASTPSGTQGSPYTGSVTGAGAVAPYTYTVSSGALPPGVTLNPSTGALSGTPTVPGTYTFSILVTDANSTPATGVGGPYTVTIAPSSGTVITVGPPTLPVGSSGVAYSQTFTAAGGAAPYAFTRTTGGLPAGLTLNAATGVLSGTPSAAGTYSFGIRATDANTEFGEQDYTVSIAAGNLLAINPPTLPGGTSGTAYSQAVSATGGAGGYTYAVTAGALPAGLSLDPATGAITGTPTAAGPASFTITATDTNGDYGSRAYSLTMAGGPILAVGPATLTGATTGASYTQALSGTGGTAPYGFSVTAGALPPGLSLASNGTLSGTPSAAGTYTFTVRVQDANGDYGTRTYSLVVAGADILTISPATLPGGTNGTAYSQALTATGGAAPYAFSVTAGSLPSGLTLSGTGALSGTPTAAGTYTFTVQALDANGDFGTRSYTLVVAGAEVLTINPATLPNGTNGTAYNQAITASGGTSPYAYTVTAGALPAGLTLSGTGALSGTPTAAGTYTFTVQALDANGDFGTRSYTLVVAGAEVLTINPATLPNGTNGTAYNQAITASGGTSPYAYTVTAGALPAGLTLSGTGALSGTPTAAGTYTFTVQALDANGDFGTRSYTLVVAGAEVLTINPATLPNGTNGTAYNQAITASGGTSPYVFSLTAGSLPTGLTLSSTGALAGTPTVAGSYAFTVQAVDGNGDFGTRSYTLVVAGADVLTINPATLPNGTNGTAYAQAITANGGTSPYAYTVTAGALPAGLTLSGTGALSGTPTAAGTYTFTVQALDANGDFGTRSYTLVVAGAEVLTINPATLPNGTNGTAYNQAITASGGTSPYAYTVTAGALPAGLTLSGTGALSGTPTAAGTYTFTVQALDANGDFGTRSYTLVVAGAEVLTINPATLPNGTNGTAYNQAITASGGTSPYVFSLTAGSLPAGLTLSSTGALAGTPTVAGSYGFTVQAVDANGDFGTRSYTVVIAGAASLAINPATLPNGTNGTAYAQAITATGGTSPYVFSLTAGSLPTGLTLSSTGTLAGTPAAAGTYTFTVQAVDANGDFGTRSYTVVIAGAASLAINPATLPNGTNGTAYNQAITATGGTSPYAYTVTAGSLPTGLTLSSTGTLAGTPTVAGSYGFTVQAVDANGDFGTRSYTMVIAGAASLAINPATLPNGTNGTAYAQAITASGGTSPYLFSLTAGSLPTGLTLSSTGALAGTPTVAGSYAFTVQAVDANGDFGTRSYTVVIAGAASLAINPATLPNGTNGTAYAQAITAAGGTSPYVFSLTAGSLPTGLTLSSTGTLSGTPTVAGSYGFTVQAVDANGNFGSRAYTLVVSGAAMLTVTPATLPGGNVQTPYGQPFSTAGGTAPYTYTTSAGSLPPGLTLSGAGLLGGTPTLAGTYTFTVRAQDANGNFGLRQVTVVIGLSIRPDPTRDTGVVDTVGEQVGALRRAGELQMGHVMRRLDSGERCEGAPEQDNGDTPCDQRRVEAWAAGTSEQHFAVQGDSHVTALTVGADTRVGRGRVGAAIGSGQDMAARASGMRNDADARTAMLYGRWDLAPSLRLDALAGRSRVEIAGRRATADGQIAVGERDATSTFASLGIAGRWTAGAAGIAPYARYEIARLALDAYTEQSTSPLALQYGAASGRTTAWVAGAEAFYGIDLSWGRLTPSARVEVRDRNGNAIAQGLWYADRPQTVYLLDVPGVSASSAMATLGLEAAFRGVTLKLEYGTAGSALRSFDGQTLRLQLRAGF